MKMGYQNADVPYSLILHKKILTNRNAEVIILKHVRESVGMVDKHV